MMVDDDDFSRFRSFGYKTQTSPSNKRKSEEMNAKKNLKKGQMFLSFFSHHHHHF